MTKQLRLAVLVAVAAVALVVKAQQPGPLFGSGGEAEAFPAEVVAEVPPTPNAHQGRPDVRVLQLLHSMDVMWKDAFAQAGDTYKPPRSIASRDGTGGDGCGGDVGGWAGVYCARDRSIVINLGANLVVKAAAGDAVSDDMLGYVLAHEVGHHVQNLRGAMHGTKALENGSLLRRELHAECLAGVWGKAAGRPLPPEWVYSGDPDHGTAAQQSAWLRRGYAQARPADCDAVWDATL